MRNGRDPNTFASTLIWLSLLLLSSPARAMSSCAGQLVLTPVPGLYESIPTRRRLRLGPLTLRTALELKDDGVDFTTSIKGRDAADAGFAQRHLDPSREHLQLLGIELKDLDSEEQVVPSFIRRRGIPDLVPGRGIPTSTFLTLWQMRIAVVEYGQLRSLSLRFVTNPITILELRTDPTLTKWLRTYPTDLPPPEWIARRMGQTHTGRYVATLLAQMGLKMGRTWVRLGHLVNLGQIAPSSQNATVKDLRSRFDPQDVFVSGFDVDVELERI